MNYGNVKYYDIANGTGVRTSLFVSGCRVHCPLCFNQITWDFKYGKEFTEEVEDRIVESLNDDYIEGLSILGGEPFEPENQERLILLLRKVRNRYKDSKTIWMYSGYLFDKDLKPEDGRKHTKYTNEIFSLIDILVDGPFINEKKRLDLNFRGSSNQRIIDMKETLKQGKVILSPLNN